ncbi:MAG: type I-G CRISPR-associated helicase/endonuclease Cas3g [Actinomycetota bacterium]
MRKRMAADGVPGGFPAFFGEVTGREPFEWQAHFTDELLAGHVPDVIDVPTGFGKTSVIVCWAYALAHASQELGLPRRLCVVVDRRLVVDASYEDARRLADLLDRPDGRRNVDLVAERLRALHGDSAPSALGVVRMRGGVTWDSRWLARPDQAAVIVGTVDQFGSRLLFRGYGVSDRMRPIDAALVGTDSWLIVDEAHLAHPLVATTRLVAAYQENAEISRPLRVTQMSATVGAAASPFRAEPDDQRRSTRFPESAAAAARRLDAAKPARLLDLDTLATGSTKGRRQLTERFGHALADRARALDPGAKVIGVIVNTIAAARGAHERLESEGEEACLLIGRGREFERQQILDEFGARLVVGAQRWDDRRLFVVATQTIEVGANFDLDAIVTECAPLSSLVQRFGRVNRIGGREPRESLIVHAGFLHDGDNDLIYGSATSETWAYLVARASVPTTSGKGEVTDRPGSVVDFELAGVRAMIDEAPDGVRAASPFVPRLLGAHLERWAATSPSPLPDQSVDPFLHGVERMVPEVSIAWRAAPPMETATEQSDDARVAAWHEWLELVRPVEWEFVNVPIWEARGLLADVPTSLPTSDLEAANTLPVEEDATTTSSDEPLGVVYRGPNKAPRLVMAPPHIAAGDRVVLDVAVGGHDRWGWTGRRAESGRTVADVADLTPSRRRGALRLDAGGRVLASLVADPDAALDVRSVVQDLVRSVCEVDASDDASDGSDIDLVVTMLGKLLEMPFPAVVTEHLHRAIDEQWQVRLTAAPGGDAVASTVFLFAPSRGQASLDMISDDDEGSTSSAPVPQSLEQHGDEVRALADELARNVRIPPQVARTVVVAAHWHDVGKADERFQRMLHDGDALAASAGEPRAKSGRDWRDPIARRARAISRVPREFRHEAVSGRVARQLMDEHSELADGLDQDLLHHLVVSHHGHGRPLLPAILDDDAPAVTVRVGEHDVVVPSDRRQIDWDHPRRFEVLNRRYGWWGLAFLEALVRLADMECSARVGGAAEQ